MSENGENGTRAPIESITKHNGLVFTVRDVRNGKFGPIVETESGQVLGMTPNAVRKGPPVIGKTYQIESGTSKQGRPWFGIKEV